MLGIVVIITVARVVFPNAFVSAFTPLWKSGDAAAASVGAVGTFFTDKQMLAQKVESLQQETGALMNENSALKARLEDLTRLVGTRTEPAPGVLAGVLARPPVSPYDVLVVDRGTRHGVNSGAFVYGAGGVPLGTIAAATENSSRVLLYSSPGKETAGWIGEAKIAVSIKGQGSGAFYAEVPRETGVVVGDQVYVAGPGALPVGAVISIDANPAATEVRVRIRPVVNPFSITWVTVSSHAGL